MQPRLNVIEVFLSSRLQLYDINHIMIVISTFTMCNIYKINDNDNDKCFYCRKKIADASNYWFPSISL